MLDEFGRVDHSVAQSIRETVSDVTNCTIYNSTHWYGRGHPFAKLLYSRKVSVIELPWYKNPEKTEGLYKSPDLNEIEFLDDYYIKKYPKVLLKGTICKYNELEKLFLIHYPEADVSLVADGENKFRSPWYDKEEARRDRRDMAQNIDMNPIGAGDMFFEPDDLRMIRQQYVKNPDFEGEVEYEVTKKGLKNVNFKRDAGRKRFIWWGKLDKGRPPQDHNYIVACDISLGVGSSNSVASVYDVNTSEKKGMFVSPDLPPSEFADQTIAICNWVGGASHRPFLIWEANGPGGSFDRRIKFWNYNFVYILRAERTRRRKRADKRGWYSNRESKYDLLLELRTALAMGLRKNSLGKKLIIYDEETVGELEDYLFYETGDIGPSKSMDETSGARSAHGDRVIPDGLYVLALNEQRKAAVVEKARVFEGSMAWRRLQDKMNISKNRRESKWLLE